MPGGSRSTQLSVSTDAGGASTLHHDGGAVPAHVCQQSATLAELLETDGCAPLPMPPELLHTWIRFAAAPDRFVAAEKDAGSLPTLARLIEVWLVSWLAVQLSEAATPLMPACCMHHGPYDLACMSPPQRFSSAWLSAARVETTKHSHSALPSPLHPWQSSDAAAMRLHPMVPRPWSAMAPKLLEAAFHLCEAVHWKSVDPEVPALRQCYYADELISCSSSCLRPPQARQPRVKACLIVLNRESASRPLPCTPPLSLAAVNLRGVVRHSKDRQTCVTM